MPVLSATDCVSPAFQRTVQYMFRPFRFAFWVRLATLGFLTGEFAGGGFNFPTSFPTHPMDSGSRHPSIPPHTWPPSWFTPAHIIGIAVAVGILFFLVTLLFLYISSVLRFVLFDTVLHGEAHIRAGWRKWRVAGRKFFVWQLLVAFVGWALLLACIGLPLLMLYTSHHIGFWFMDATAVAVLALSFLGWFVFALAFGVVIVLAKDFVVPIMALEGVGWQEGWNRFFVIARGHASEYVLYLVMKIVQRIAAGIGHTLLVFMLVLILIVPGIVAGVAGVAIAAGATTAVKALMITLGIVALMVAMLLVIAFSAFVGAPISYFFPAYAIYFFAGRYAPLGEIIFPAPPAPPSPAPEAPPLPA